MDGLFHGKPYEQMDDLGGFPIIFGNTQLPFPDLPFAGNTLGLRIHGGCFGFADRCGNHRTVAGHSAGKDWWRCLGTVDGRNLAITS